MLRCADLRRNRSKLEEHTEEKLRSLLCLGPDPTILGPPSDLREEFLMKIENFQIKRRS